MESQYTKCMVFICYGMVHKLWDVSGIPKFIHWGPDLQCDGLFRLFERQLHLDEGIMVYTLGGLVSL